jgi:hypothetical protein
MVQFENDSQFHARELLTVINDARGSRGYLLRGITRQAGKFIYQIHSFPAGGALAWRKSLKRCGGKVRGAVFCRLFTSTETYSVCGKMMQLVLASISQRSPPLGVLKLARLPVGHLDFHGASTC